MINSKDKFLETEPSRPELYYKSTRPSISQLEGGYKSTTILISDYINC